MATPDHLVQAVRRLAEQSGQRFQITAQPTQGTQMYVVYAENHWLPEKYTASAATLGFRVGEGYPDSNPEDSFFIYPSDIKLKEQDPARKSVDIHRAGINNDILKQTGLPDVPVLIFSWHLWDRSKWVRSKHTLLDHYQHCLRRFEIPEHDV